MTNCGHWRFFGDFDVDDSFGFVYLITNLKTGRKYLGKKQFHSYKKNKRFKETDWRNYCGSSKELLADIKKIGKKNFLFQILQVYKTRGGLVYGEANLQHKFNVLTERSGDEERIWYNKNIAGIKFIPKEYYS